MELFLYGNPRLLAGGEPGRTQREGYENDPLLLTGQGHTTETLESMIEGDSSRTGASSLQLASLAGESIHSGKGCYHSTIKYNKFLVPGQWPSLGVEIETIASAYNREHAIRLCEDLHSNWFHFERDGSLDDAHSGEFGFELITEPLPPRVYRNPNTWIGLENILSPWLESFDHACTGLHVHVGLNQFMDMDMPIENRVSRMYIGKLMCLLTYFTIADAAFIDRVCLRKQTRYCRTPGERQLFEGTAKLASGAMTGYEFIDLAINKLLSQNISNWNSQVCWANDHLRANDTCPSTFCQAVMNGTTSHGTEVNTEHKFTIEFRRGKGTLHALSVHRMIEFYNLLVRYTGKIVRNPEEKVSKKGFYEFIHDNTTSAPLKKFVEDFSTVK